MPDDLNLSNLKPAAPRKNRKRVGRGLGSGKGRYSGRGIKGQKSRSGSHKMRAGFEGGQMPIYMRLPKQRGSYSKDAMPVGPHRTSTVPVNVSQLERFDTGAEITVESLVEAGIIKNSRTDVKILGMGELTKKLTVTAHRFSATAREKIEQAGGTANALREPLVRKRKRKAVTEPAASSEPEPDEPKLRHRVLFTALILALYRLGSWMPSPGVNSQAIQSYFNSGGRSGSILGLLNLFSGSALSRFSIFALGIMPYVTASIILQLLTVVIPKLEELQKEGEAGYAKINQYTRYLTVFLAAAQSLGYAYLFKRQSTGNGHHVLEANAGRLVLIVLTLTAGTTLLMWMGELITKRGVGNGISLLIFASILATAPTGIAAWYNGGTMERLFFPLVAIAIVVAVVFIQEGQRRIPIQYAKRMVGRRMTSGGTTYMPLRVNMARVIPVIFAAAVLAFPPTIAQFFPATQGWINAHFSYGSLLYIGLEGVLIIVFTYFYTAVQFNPVDQADNLRKYGGYIPGIRPGAPTAQYLDRVLTRLTLPGSLYLAAVAVLPSIFIKYGGFSQATSRALGGTSVLIVVGVALDTMRQMESQMMMRNYEGFLK